MMNMFDTAELSIGCPYEFDGKRSGAARYSESFGQKEAGYSAARSLTCTQDVDYRGHTHHTSKEEPLYAIKSDKTRQNRDAQGSALVKANN
jgi:hypothetical protein